MPSNYTPGGPPIDPTPETLLRYVIDELTHLATAVNSSSLQLDELHVEPSRLRDGLVAMADGTDWNPGSGKGAYLYRSGAWHFLG